MKVVVSGGAGFIGSHVVDALVDAAHDVVVIDREPPRYPNRRATYLQFDVRDPLVWPRALDGADAVSHQAARVGLGVCFADVADYVGDNDAGTAAMLLAMDQVGFTGRVVLASSMVVYGDGAYTCRACGSVRPAERAAERLVGGLFEPACPRCGGDLQPELTKEDAQIDPRNVYAATKIHQEHLCFAYGRESGTSVVALRYHNVYGPRSPVDTPYAGVASIFLSALRAGSAPQVFEDGGQRRDFVHVSDVARGKPARGRGTAGGGRRPQHRQRESAHDPRPGDGAVVIPRMSRPRARGDGGLAPRRRASHPGLAGPRRVGPRVRGGDVILGRHLGTAVTTVGKVPVPS